MITSRDFMYSHGFIPYDIQEGDPPHFYSTEEIIRLMHEHEGGPVTLLNTMGIYNTHDKSIEDVEYLKMYDINDINNEGKMGYVFLYTARKTQTVHVNDEGCFTIPHIPCPCVYSIHVDDELEPINLSNYYASIYIENKPSIGLSFQYDKEGFIGTDDDSMFISEVTLRNSNHYGKFFKPFHDRGLRNMLHTSYVDSIRFVPKDISVSTVVKGKDVKAVVKSCNLYRYGGDVFNVGWSFIFD